MIDQPHDRSTALLLSIRVVRSPRQRLGRTRKRGTAMHSHIHESVRGLDGYRYRRVNMRSDRVRAPKTELLIPLFCQSPDERYCVRRQSSAGFHSEGQQLGTVALGDVVVLDMLLALLAPCHTCSGVCATGLGGMSPSIAGRQRVRDNHIAEDVGARE